MTASLRFRLWLSYLLMVGLVLAIVLAAIAYYLWRNPTQTRQEMQRLRAVASLLTQRGELFNSLPLRPAGSRLEAGLERIDRALNVRLLVFDPNGQLLADSRAGREPDLPALAARQAAEAAQRGESWERQGAQNLFAARPMENGNLLVVSAPRPHPAVVAVLRDEFLQPILRAVAVALLASLLLAVGLTRWVSGPLARMADAARAVAAGRAAPIPLDGPVEVQSLARAFNEMAEQVQSSRQSQRDFVANVSHELKTPLTSIQGFSQAIVDGAVSTPEGLQQAAGVIHSEAQRMHRMVLELLDLARLDAGADGLERHPLDLAALLRTLTEKFSPQAQAAQVSVRIEVAALPAVMGDGDRLAQVFSNLLDNAIQHTPPGGEVLVAASAAAGWVEVRVLDGGAGIPEAELERIFERFYQTDKSRKRGAAHGFGLGLAIARQVVQAHGGTIVAQNKNEMSPARSGAVFVVKIPIITA